MDAKLAELQMFDKWWEHTVDRPGGDRKSFAGNAANDLSCKQAEELTGMRHQRVSDMRRDLKDLVNFRNKLLGKEYVAAHLEDPNVRGTEGTGENEWFTPLDYLDRLAARLSDPVS